MSIRPTLDEHRASEMFRIFCDQNHIVCSVEHSFGEMARVEVEHIPTGHSFTHRCWRFCPEEINAVMGKAEYLFELNKESKGCIRKWLFSGIEIAKVIFNNPATIVIWDDGSKTVVKAENEPFDPEKGLAMAIAKKALGNKGNYYETFKKHLPKTKKLEFKPDGKLPIARVNAVVREEDGLRIEAIPVRYLTTAEKAEELKCSVDTIRKLCANGQFTGAIKVKGKWMIPSKIEKE